MKTAEISTAVISKTKIKYDFDLYNDGVIVACAVNLYDTKDECISIVKESFPEFKIIDKTHE